MELEGPPLEVVQCGRFHSGCEAEIWGEPNPKEYRHTARRIAFEAVLSMSPNAALSHAFHAAFPGQLNSRDYCISGAWLIADADGQVSAHRGVFVGPGTSWDLATAIIPGTASAATRPVMTGYYRQRPDEYRQRVAHYDQAMRHLVERHREAVAAGNLFARLIAHRDEHFLPLLRAAATDRSAQMIFHDWLAERGFPHASELLEKKWNSGLLTPSQLLSLLTKAFSERRRSFRGRTIQDPPER